MAWCQLVKKSALQRLIWLGVSRTTGVQLRLIAEHLTDFVGYILFLSGNLLNSSSFQFRFLIISIWRLFRSPVNKVNCFKALLAVKSIGKTKPEVSTIPSVFYLRSVHSQNSMENRENQHIS